MPGLDDLKNFPIPEIAKGTVLPNFVYQKIQEEENQQQQLNELMKISDSTQRQLKIMEEQLSKYKNELESGICEERPALFQNHHGNRHHNQHRCYSNTLAIVIAKDARPIRSAPIDICFALRLWFLIFSNSSLVCFTSLCHTVNCEKIINSTFRSYRVFDFDAL